MQGTPATPRGPKGEIRGGFKMLLLWMCTCGIYALWWYFKVSSEVNAFLGYNRMSALKILGLSSVTCGIYGFYFIFVDGKKIIGEVQAKAGLPVDPPFMAGPMQIQSALNKVWAAC
ncbi:MAG: DUF4234 domain-containing protein [Deltaproteobacteria bacterium]|nr:DUF4234 domain-containing protein [Deltaproteobacteria bacterium]